MVQRLKAGAIALLVVSTLGCSDILAPGDDSMNSSSSTPAGPSGPAALTQVERIEFEAFEATVFPILRENCTSCHSGNGPGRPDIAHPDAMEAWDEVNTHSAVNFANPAASLLVRRLAEDSHECWSDCMDDALEMQAEIVAWNARIENQLGGSDLRVQTPSTFRAEATATTTSVALTAPAYTGGREPITVVSDAPSNGFPLGQSIVTWTLTDAGGNRESVTQIVVLADTTAPVVTAPPAVIATATGTLTPVNLGIASAQDVLSGTLVAVNNAPANFPIGTTLVEWTATDAEGNVGRATQSVTINALNDTALMLVAPVPVSAEATAPLSTIDFGQATATGGTPPLVITNNAPSAGFAVGGQSVTWTVRDAADRTSMATQQVLVVDTTAPSITAPPDVTTPAESTLTPVSIGAAIASDLADPSPVLTNNAPPGGFAVGTTLVTWTARDASGNVASALQQVIVQPVVGDAAAGATAYADNCQVCHTADISLNLFNIQRGTSSTAIEDALRNVSQMEDLAFLLDNAQMRADIAAYILSQMEEGPPVSSCDDEGDLIQPTKLLRLSKLQYSNTLRDLLRQRLGNSTGDGIHASLDSQLALIPDDHSQTGYASSDQRVSSTHIEGYLEVAFAFAEAVTASNARLTDFVGESCATNFGDQACRERFVADFGSIALRHPLSTDEIDFYSDAADYRELIASILMAPGFLSIEQYRGTLDPTNPDHVVLNAYELATKLAYHFWQTMPDAALWQAAASGEILNDYASVVDDVFSDPKTRTGMREFFRGWLDLDEILEFPANPTLRANFLAADYGTGTNLPANTNLSDYQNAAIEEVLALTEYTTFERDGSVGDLFTSTGSFATDPTLAAAYGVSTWNGGSSPPVSFGSAQPRSGLLSRAALQMYGDFNSHPILKGARIRKQFLCDDLDVPADIEAPAEAVIHPEFSTRELTEAITEIPGTACAGCHEPLINPLGFPTESFDALGRYRTEEVLFDDDGFERLRALIDTRTVPRVDPSSNETATDAIDLGALVGASPKAEACFARNYYRFSQRREEVDQTDQCEIDTLEEAVGTAGIQGMLKAQALLPEFKVRSLPN